MPISKCIHGVYLDGCRECFPIDWDAIPNYEERANTCLVPSPFVTKYLLEGGLYTIAELEHKVNVLKRIQEETDLIFEEHLKQSMSEVKKHIKKAP